MGLLSKVTKGIRPYGLMEYGDLKERMEQLIKLGFSNADIAKMLNRTDGNAARYRSLFNAAQEPGQRVNNKGELFALPVIGGISGMQWEDD